MIGKFFQDVWTSFGWGDWALHAASPLRAVENQPGVQDPVGFENPHGFTSDGKSLAFKPRREIELQHGRIAMLAALGYITPELVVKFPGDLPPSLGVKAADFPNGVDEDLIT